MQAIRARGPRPACSRNLVERFLVRIKQFRRMATRYDKLSRRYASFVAAAASFIWLV
ncbi:transposase [Burkholderia cepacia]|nr:transposase [Burkholderia cepacia]MCA8024202.1 transposase [Burkholderia cepacia]